MALDQVSLNYMLVGGIAMASLAIALFFLRFWKASGDRFFLFFAASFLIEAFNRVLFWQGREPAPEVGVYYLLRLLEYSLILVAILYKNRPRRDDT